MKLTIKYAKEELNASEINLGVFKDNVSAHKCYTLVEFKEKSIEKFAYYYEDEAWDCIELFLEGE